MSNHQLANDNIQVPECYKQTEVGVIPEDWEVISLGEHTSFVRSGKSVVKKELGNYPLYGSTGVISYSQSFEYEGDAILVARVGANAGKVNFVSGKYGVSDNTIIVKFKNNSNIHFFLYQLRKKNLNSLVFGSGQPLITGTQLKNLSVFNPKLEEQRAIAQTLSDVDGLIAALDKLIAKKRNIKTATMQELLTGKKRLPGFGGEWETKRLGDIAHFYKGVGLSKAELMPEGTNRCIHYGELFTIYGEKISKVISGTNSKSRFVYSQENDVLMPTSDVTTNGLATASCITKSDVILGGDILVIRTSKNIIDGEFLAYSVKINRNQIMQLVSGTTVFHLYGRDMANLVFNVPEVKEQRAIASILSDMDAEIAALEKRRAKTKAIKQGMMEQLLTGKTRLIVPSNA
ncbi:MAG: restriction endonuclease subunit S [Hormoscilla sp. GUM202]|nr:restriction endonuclease subunit S [Hormoscilla sp. GUM202]